MRGRKGIIMRYRVLISLVLLLSVSLASAEERRPTTSSRSTELRSMLSRVRGVKTTWRIAESTPAQNRIDRLGTIGSPLELVNSAGRVAGEVYRVEELGRYQGFVLLRSQSALDIRSEFFARKWPLDQLSKAFQAIDADDPLKEPRMHLAIDEDRLVLRVNLGKTEREFEFTRFDPDEEAGR